MRKNEKRTAEYNILLSFAAEAARAFETKTENEKKWKCLSRQKSFFFSFFVFRFSLFTKCFLPLSFACVNVTD